MSEKNFFLDPTGPTFDRSTFYEADEEMPVVDDVVVPEDEAVEPLEIAAEVGDDDVPYSAELIGDSLPDEESPEKRQAA